MRDEKSTRIPEAAIRARNSRLSRSRSARAAVLRALGVLDDINRQSITQLTQQLLTQECCTIRASAGRFTCRRRKIRLYSSLITLGCPRAHFAMDRTSNGRYSTQL